MTEKFGPYSVLAYFTQGGMADLYLVRHPEQSQLLVLKKVQNRYEGFTRVVKMFLDEGRIAQVLNHPNVVRIVDVGRDADTDYIVMEYIPGRDLISVIREAAQQQLIFPERLAIGIVEQLLVGLVHAHEKVDDKVGPLHIVHCDISPGNILLSWGGTVKILDFGIARAVIQLRTEDHSVAGKYNYMAPEQIRGEAVDARADLFSVGVLLYELTSGKRLFRGRPEQVMELVLNEPILAPSQIRPDFSPALEAVIMRALERSATNRFPSARAMLAALRGVQNRSGETWSHGDIASFLRDVFGASYRRELASFELPAELDPTAKLAELDGVPPLLVDASVAGTSTLREGDASGVHTTAKRTAASSARKDRQRRKSRRFFDLLSWLRSTWFDR